MSKQRSASPDAAFLLSGVILWLLSSLLQLPLFAAVVYKWEPEEAALGYFVSALSFLSAGAAGYAASKKRGKAAVFTGLLVGCTVICLALTLGFLMDGNRINADSVLSLVTFSLAGSVVGAVLPSGREPKKKKKFSFSVNRA